MSEFNFKKDIQNILSKYPDNKTISVIAVLSPIEWDSAVIVTPSSRYTKIGVGNLALELQGIDGATYSDGMLIFKKFPQEGAKDIAKYFCQYLRDTGYKTTYVEKEKQFGESVIEALRI